MSVLFPCYHLLCEFGMCIQIRAALQAVAQTLFRSAWDQCDTVEWRRQVFCTQPAVSLQTVS